MEDAERKAKHAEYMRAYAKRDTNGYCTVDGCQRPMYGRSGLCAMHYQRRRLYGAVGEATPRFMQGFSVEERFWAKADYHEDESCWGWSGAHFPDGYGLIAVNGTSTGVHRVAYEIAFGPIPAELEIDHLCRNRGCCNPNHLEAVTRRENSLRGEGPTAENAWKTHCKRGHPLDGPEAVLKHTKGRSGRQCRICVRLRRNERYKRLGR